MMQARIYRPARTATQSGRARSQRWILEFAPSSARQRDPLMGWTSSRDTLAQLRIGFDSAEEAVAYAERCGLSYVLDRGEERKPRPKNYADNFRFDRPEPWTH
jgi:hypothetical protein